MQLKCVRGVAEEEAGPGEMRLGGRRCLKFMIDAGSPESLLR